jgi:hypothetical protein
VLCGGLISHATEKLYKLSNKRLSSSIWRWIGKLWGSWFIQVGLGVMMHKTYYYKTKLAKKMGIFWYEKNRTHSLDT